MASASQVAQLTRPGAAAAPVLEGLDIALRTLRSELPLHVTKELSILFPELDAAAPWGQETLSEVRRRHRALDVRHSTLQGRALAVLLGDTTPRAMRAARRAALAFLRELEGLAALEEGEVVAGLIRALPPAAAERVITLFAAAEARGHHKQLARL